jgi:hypothetical protein
MKESQNHNWLNVKDIEKLKRAAIIQSEFYGFCAFVYDSNDVSTLKLTINLNDVFSYASDSYDISEDEVDEIFDILVNEKNKKAAYNKVILFIAEKRKYKGRIELL